MPTPISHAAVGYALGAWLPHDTPPSATRVCITAAACAALPDIDVLGFVPHRSITHSLAFAVVAGVLAAVLVFRDQSARTRRQLMLICVIALLSHSLLDGLTTYSMGVEYLAPFSQVRYRFLWTPLGRPDGELLNELVLEALVVFLPAAVLAWLGVRRRRRAKPA